MDKVKDSPRDYRTVEERLRRQRLTDEAAAGIIEAERLARERKTVRLRELRLAKNATAGLPIVDKRLKKTPREK
jgi:hypothetical protein